MALRKQPDHQIIHTVGKGREREQLGLGESPSFLSQFTCPGSWLLSAQLTFIEFLLSAKHCAMYGWGHGSKEVITGVMSSKKNSYVGPHLGSREGFLEEA